MIVPHTTTLLVGMCCPLISTPSHSHPLSFPHSQHEVEALLAHIHLPLDSATVRLGMSKGKIKTLMTRLGIRRWPSKWVVKCVNALLQQHAAGRSVHAGNFRDVVCDDVVMMDNRWS